jgi:PAS domain S-box-containing protein
MATKPKSVSKPDKKNQSQQDDLSNIVDKGEQAAPGSNMDITGHKQAESPREDAFEALRQSEEKYRNILENIAEGYFEVDFAGTLTFFNDSVCLLLGYSKEEMIGLNYRQFTDKENAEILVQNYIKVYKTGKAAKEVSYQIIRKDGTKRYVEASVSLKKDSSGNPIAFYSITHDITERSRMEEELLASEARYRSILEDIDEGYFESDRSGKLTLVNDAHARNLQYSKEDLIGMDFRQFCDEKTAQRMRELYIQVAQTGKPFKSFEAEFYAKDGTKRIVEFSGSLRRDQQSNVIGSRGISRDVTERNKMEDAVRQSEERYRTILDEMDNGYFEVDGR